jgi:hypothetical protein
MLGRNKKVDPYTGVEVYDILKVLGDNSINVWTLQRTNTMTSHAERDNLHV